MRRGSKIQWHGGEDLPAARRKESRGGNAVCLCKNWIILFYETMMWDKCGPLDRVWKGQGGLWGGRTGRKRGYADDGSTKKESECN